MKEYSIKNTSVDKNWNIRFSIRSNFLNKTVSSWLKTSTYFPLTYEEIDNFVSNYKWQFWALLNDLEKERQSKEQYSEDILLDIDSLDSFSNKAFLKKIWEQYYIFNHYWEIIDYWFWDLTHNFREEIEEWVFFLSFIDYEKEEKTLAIINLNEWWTIEKMFKYLDYWHCWWDRKYFVWYDDNWLIITDNSLNQLEKITNEINILLKECEIELKVDIMNNLKELKSNSEFNVYWSLSSHFTIRIKVSEYKTINFTVYINWNWSVLKEILLYDED